MKVLILSSNNGQGHNSAAKALVECAERRGYTAVMIDAIIFDSPHKSELLERIHIRSALHAPKLFEKGTRFAERIEESGLPAPDSRSVERPSQRLARFIKDNAFDTVIATHIFAAQILTRVDKDYRETLTTAFVTTDYSYVPFTSETQLDAYFLPHKGLLDAYEKNAPGKNFFASGIPTQAALREKAEKVKARIALGLPQDAPLAVIMTGSMGFGDVIPIIDVFLTRSLGTYVVILCGTNAKLYKTLQMEFAAKDHVLPISYTDRVGLYLDAADVLLSKPGGLSSTEAAVKEVPLVHITPLPGWEENNVRFFESLGLSCSGDTPAKMAEAAIRLLTDKGAAEQMMDCQHREINKVAAEMILDILYNMKTQDRTRS